MKKQIATFAIGYIVSVLLLTIHPSLSNALIYDYRYTGNLFNSFRSLGENPYSSSDYISIEIQAGQQSNILNAPSAFFDGCNPFFNFMMITDGVKEFTSDMSYGVWRVWVGSVDNLGLPTTWYVSYYDFLDGDVQLISSYGFITTDFDMDMASDHKLSPMDPMTGEYDYYEGKVSNQPGVWSLSVLNDIPTVPEPSTEILFLIGMVSVVGVTRLRRGK